MYLVLDKSQDFFLADGRGKYWSLDEAKKKFPDEYRDLTLEGVITPSVFTDDKCFVKALEYKFILNIGEFYPDKYTIDYVKECVAKFGGEVTSRTLGDFHVTVGCKEAYLQMQEDHMRDGWTFTSLMVDPEPETEDVEEDESSMLIVDEEESEVEEEVEPEQEEEEVKADSETESCDELPNLDDIMRGIGEDMAAEEEAENEPVTVEPEQEPVAEDPEPEPEPALEPVPENAVNSDIEDCVITPEEGIDDSWYQEPFYVPVKREDTMQNRYAKLTETFIPKSVRGEIKAHVDELDVSILHTAKDCLNAGFEKHGSFLVIDIYDKWLRAVFDCGSNTLWCYPIELCEVADE